MITNDRRPPWGFALGLAGLLLCLPGVCRAQEDVKTEEKDPGHDEELRKLRAEADEELEEDRPGASSEEEALRREADLDIEEDDSLYQNLLNAFSSISNRLNAFNPRITVFGDVLARIAASSKEFVEDGVNRDDRIGLREVELDLRADIDPYAKAVLILAAEEHVPGEYEVGIEEGYVTLETLPVGLHAKLGRFRIPFGQFNRLHTHDLPQATRPVVLTDFFGEEGLIENGARVSWLTPWIPLTFTALVLNGENDAAFAGRDSDDPAYMGRVELFKQLSDTIYISAGTSFLFGYNDAPADVARDSPRSPRRETQIYGGDLLFKWQPSQFTSLVLQGEVYWLKKERAGRTTEYGFGGFVFAQYQLSQRWFVGARFDWSNYLEGTEDRKHYVAGAWLSFYTTEFLRFRVGYEHHERASTIDTKSGAAGEPDLDTVFFQVTFVFGSHPVEPFWFNK